MCLFFDCFAAVAIIIDLNMLLLSDGRSEINNIFRFNYRPRIGREKDTDREMEISSDTATEIERAKRAKRANADFHSQLISFVIYAVHPIQK